MSILPRTRWQRLTPLVVLLVPLAVACSSSNDPEPAATDTSTTAATTSSSTPRSTASASSTAPTTPTTSTSPPSEAPVDGVSAQAVVDEFVASDLPSTGMRDNTVVSGCPGMGCVQMISVDPVSVYQFADLGSAAHYAELLPAKTHQNGLIVLRFKYDGPNLIRPELIPRYEEALARVVDAG